MFVWLSIAFAGVVAFLCWKLYRGFGTNRIEALMNERRGTSRMVSRGEYVDGSRHLAVALALTNSDFFYQNSDMEASIDLRWIREIVYDTSLTTGQPVAGGKVLRIRCFSQLFEFIVPDESLVRWHMMLPPRKWKESPAGTELAARAAVAS